jgi:uncharacterized membrane protein YfbV (UPF0208 family)
MRLVSKFATGRRCYTGKQIAAAVGVLAATVGRALNRAGLNKALGARAGPPIPKRQANWFVSTLKSSANSIACVLTSAAMRTGHYNGPRLHGSLGSMLPSADSF